MDDLKRIRGLGQALERKFIAQGVATFAALAGLGADDKVRLDEKLAVRGGVDWDEFQKQAAEFAAQAHDASQSSQGETNSTDSSQSAVSGGAGDSAGSPPETNAGSEPEPGAQAGGDRHSGRASGGVVTVEARKSRRRAGRAFGPEAVDIPIDELTEAEFNSIKGDPQLSVTITQ